MPKEKIIYLKVEKATHKISRGFIKFHKELNIEDRDFSFPGKRGILLWV